MKNFVDQPVENYAKIWTQPESGLLHELIEDTYSSTDMPQMLSGRLSGRFLKLLTQISNAKFAVEIGMFTGYSALSIAEGLPENGKLITCDVNEEYAIKAKSYFSRSPYGEKIEVRIGPALETLSSIHNKIDLAFIDADKVNYMHYYEAILAKMESGGIIVIDNCLWSGEVLNPVSDSGKAIDAVNQMVAKDPRVENVILTVRDGLNLIRKK